jgi:HEAT repeat protein
MLARQRDERDVPALIAALNDPYELVRANAVIALGAIATQGALEAVSCKTQDPSIKVREWVNEVLRK